MTHPSLSPELADAIRTVIAWLRDPTSAPEPLSDYVFDMSEWIESNAPDRCCCCIGGALELVLGEVALVGEAILNRPLFYQWNVPAWNHVRLENVPAAAAIRVLERLLETGEVDWGDPADFGL